MKLTDLGPGRGLWKRDPDMPDSEVNLDYMMDEQVIAGDPRRVCAAAAPHDGGDG